MENLSRSFFIDLARKYPEAIAHFQKWLEGYKKQTNWYQFIANRFDFYDIPYDMQNGIIARYDIECFYGKGGYTKIRADEPRRYEKLFIDVQDAIDDNSIKNI